MKKFLFALLFISSLTLRADEPKSDKACADCTADETAAVCPVSGKEPGKMGKPYTYVYKVEGQPDREVQLCCERCVAKFEKEPAKYIAKIDAAKKAKAEKKEKSACCEDQSCESCAAKKQKA